MNAEQKERVTTERWKRVAALLSERAAAASSAEETRERRRRCMLNGHRDGDVVLLRRDACRAPLLPMVAVCRRCGAWWDANARGPERTGARSAGSSWSSHSPADAAPECAADAS